MIKAKFQFPRGFLWGTATASHQVEGNNKNNNWWQWEQIQEHIAEGHKSGKACDWWGGKWREDFDRAQETHQNAHRFSIEWSRVQPAPDRFDYKALEVYREMVRGLMNRNMTPIVTLHHFSDPLWFAELGGWENENAPNLFVTYIQKVIEALHEYVKLWVTINEPNVYVVEGYNLGTFPPGKTSLKSSFQVMENLVRAHAQAYQAIHNFQTTARVGAAINLRRFEPSHKWSPFDHWAARNLHHVFNEAFPKALNDGILRLPFRRVKIKEAANTQDFLGINYYTRDLVSFDITKPNELFSKTGFDENDNISESGFIANVPTSFFEVIKWGTQFNIPIIITENGVDGLDDSFRRRYIIEHIHQVWRAVNFNFPVKGYFYWTLIDNFEWERGWTQRFGLWELDEKTQKRSKRQSADLYSEICKENGISSEIVNKYSPEIFDKLFPS